MQLGLKLGRSTIFSAGSELTRLKMQLVAVHSCLVHKTRHPGIAFGARIGGGTTLGKRVKIGSNSTVFRSHVGDDVTIQHGCSVSNAELEGNNVIYASTGLHAVRVGRFSYVGRDSALSDTSIGRFCSLGPELLCGPGEHPTRFVSTSPVFFSTRNQCGTHFSDKDYYDEKKDIAIGNDVWIGARVFVRDGVRIGHGAIIAAGAFVVADVPDYAIVGGVPARTIRLRFTEQAIERLIKLQWWDWDIPRLKEAHAVFAQEDVELFLEWAAKAA